MSRLLAFLRKELYFDALQGAFRWWIVAVPLLPIVLVIVTDRVGWDWVLVKENHETVALYLTGGALALAGLRLGVSRRAFYGIMTFLAAAILFREIHPPHTGNLVYLNVAVSFAWMYVWRRRIEREMTTPWILTAFVGSWLCYVASVLVARRVFHFIPAEHRLHIAIEENLETAGHVIWLLLFVRGAKGGSGTGERGTVADSE